MYIQVDSYYVIIVFPNGHQGNRIVKLIPISSWVLVKVPCSTFQSGRRGDLSPGYNTVQLFLVLNKAEILHAGLYATINQFKAFIFCNTLSYSQWTNFTYKNLIK